MNWENNQRLLRSVLVLGLILILVVTGGFIFFNQATNANNLATCESCNKTAVSNLELVPKQAELSLAELEQMRMEIYQNNYTFTVAQNATEYHLYGFNPDLLKQTSVSAPRISSVAENLPEKFDWREKNGVTPVKNQGNCGSCWAFGTVGIFESAILINEGKTVDLSEQYLVSCNTDKWGCKGGWWAHNYHQKPGAVLEECFPYQAADVACKSDCAHPYQISKWGYVDREDSVPSVEAIKTAIYKYGPIGVAVAADNYFQSYSGGVFNRNYTGQVNHAVILVGWDDAQKCWIMKNSWGTSWGESGYMRIGYNISKIGYAASYVVYESGNPSPSPSLNPSPSLEPSPIPSIEPSPASKNIALNKPVSASEYYSDYLPKYSVDGDLDSRWACVASKDQWLKIDLQNKYKVKSLRIKWSTSNNYPRKYNISWWNGAEWVVEKKVDGDGDWDEIKFSKSIETQYLRIDCSKASILDLFKQYYLVYECEVYEE